MPVYSGTMYMQQDSQSNLQIPNCRLIFDRMDLRFHFHFAQFFLSSPFVLFCQLCHFLHSSHFMHTWLQLNTRYTCCIMAMFCYLFFSLSYVSVSFLHHQRHSKNADFHAAHSTASSNVKYVACSAKRKTRKKMEMNKYGSEFLCMLFYLSFFLFFFLSVSFSSSSLCLWLFFVRLNVTNTSNWWRLHQILGMILNSWNDCCIVWHIAGAIVMHSEWNWNEEYRNDWKCNVSSSGYFVDVAHFSCDYFEKCENEIPICRNHNRHVKV